jgi:hypothetical protein
MAGPRRREPIQIAHHPVTRPRSGELTARTSIVTVGLCGTSHSGVARDLSIMRPDSRLLATSTSAFEHQPVDYDRHDLNHSRFLGAGRNSDALDATR